MSKMMRISDSTNTTLNDLHKSTGKTKQALIEVAIEKLYKEYFLKKANIAYAKLKKDKKNWKEEQKEHKLWDYTLEDCLKDE